MKMIQSKLTKTEQMILDHMNRRNGRYSATVSYGHKAGGGCIPLNGMREFNACQKLVERGLAELACPISRHQFSQHGWTEFSTDISIKLL
jgi:hypothetical protein